jgi:hypothetical protein
MHATSAAAANNNFADRPCGAEIPVTDLRETVSAATSAHLLTVHPPAIFAAATSDYLLILYPPTFFAAGLSPPLDCVERR